MDFSEIKNLRRRLGWSQSDLARRLGVEQQVVAAFEEGALEIEAKLSSQLQLIAKYAEQCSEELVVHAIADQVLEDSDLEQISNNEVSATL
ncbi:MAG: helix-turn-helix domain-containing protein [Bdellovibrionia bacterium]